jgi:hypothetical protein
LEFRQNFNPALAGGIRGAPGIKARLNPRAFQYLSTIFVGILSERQLLYLQQFSHNILLLFNF